MSMNRHIDATPDILTAMDRLHRLGLVCHPCRRTRRGVFPVGGRWVRGLSPAAARETAPAGSHLAVELVGGVVGVDLDEKNGKSGSAELEQAGITLPAGFGCRTPHGGTHRLFRTAQTVTTCEPLRGVELKARGWLVMAGRGYPVFGDGLPELPGALLDTARRCAATRAQRSAVPTAIPSATLADLSDKQRATLDQAVQRVATAPRGQRSEADFAAACWAAKLGLCLGDFAGLVGGVGKFAERGGRYTEYTFRRAVERVGVPNG